MSGIVTDGFDRFFRKFKTLLSSRVDNTFVEKIGEWFWRIHIYRVGKRLGPLPASITLLPGEVTHYIPLERVGKKSHDGIAGSWAQYGVRLDLAAGAILNGPPRVAIDSSGSIVSVGGVQHFNLHESGEISAEVVHRDRKWSRFVLEVKGYAVSRGGHSYQPYCHPDLRGTIAVHNHSRFDALKEHLPIRTGRLLDIGANAGYFCHRFEDVGLQCIAVERSVKEHYILKKQRDSLNKTFTIEHSSFQSLPPTRCYDIVLALNIFHHLLKTRARFEELKHFLNQLDTTWMFLEVHGVNERQLASADVRMTPEQLREFVMLNANLPYSDLIGEEDGRQIFLLGKYEKS